MSFKDSHPRASESTFFAFGIRRLTSYREMLLVGFLVVLLSGCAAQSPPAPEPDLYTESCLTEANVKRVQAFIAARRQLEDAKTDYTVSTGDLLGLTIHNFRPDGADFNSEMRVDDRGNINLPFTDPINVGGMSLMQVRRVVISALQEAQVLHAPLVSVKVKEFQGQQVVLLGAVKAPGTYNLSTGSQYLVDVISRAGGLSERAGNIVQIVEGAREGSDEFALAQGADPTVVNDGNRLLREAELISLCIDTPAGEPNRLALNLPIRGGDVVVVPDAGQAYIEGEVEKPGPYPIVRGMTVTQLIASAGGLSFPAKISNVKVVRASAPGQAREWELDLNRIRKYEQPDFVLERNDRIVVPYTVAGKLAYGGYQLVVAIVRFTIGGNLAVF